jgi:germacradienol/geosmin synthase
MPLDAGDARLEPANLVERSLLDVWSRIAAPMSPAWRRRFARDIQDMNESFLWELGNATEDIVPDLIEYLEMRRLTGGAFWAVDLLEYALGIELPSAIYCAHPIRLLHNICGDAMLLFNDILSYEKELEVGEKNNSVLVVQEFLGCDLQRAVGVVNDLVTARLKAAEKTMLTEVTPLLDEHALAPRQRDDVLRYVQGLMDGVAGCFEWQMRSGRYRRAPSAT